MRRLLSVIPPDVASSPSSLSPAKLLAAMIAVSTQSPGDTAGKKRKTIPSSCKSKNGGGGHAVENKSEEYNDDDEDEEDEEEYESTINIAEVGEYPFARPFRAAHILYNPPSLYTRGKILVDSHSQAVVMMVSEGR